MKEEKQINVYILSFLVPFISIFGMAMYFPMFLHFQKIYGITEQTMSYLPTIGMGALIIVILLVGKWIERLGTKKVLITCLVLWNIGIAVEMLGIWMRQYPVMCIGRVLHGLGDAGYFPVLLSMSAALLSSKQQKNNASVLEFSSAVGGTIAAVLAGWFSNQPLIVLGTVLVLGIVTAVFAARNAEDVQKMSESNEVEGAVERAGVYRGLIFF